MKNRTRYNKKMLSCLILSADITEEEMVEYFKLTGTTKFELTNGYVVSYRPDCNYVWVSGGEGDESFELGLDLFNAITKNAEKEMADMNKTNKVEV